MAWKISPLSLLRSNLLAIISVLIALASLSYNTWRNDATEINRNQRAAGFAALQELAALQLLTDHITYGNDHDKGDPIAGWTRVIFICDLARLTSPDLEAQPLRLKESWAAHVERLDDDEAANKTISGEIAAMREGTLKTLRSLR